MGRAAFIVLSLGTAGLAATESAPAPSTPPKAAPIDFAKEIGPVIEKYCFECHTGDEPEGELSLYFETERDFLKRAKSERSHFQRMAEVLREYEMPPPKHPQPSNAQRERMIEWIERSLLPLDPKGVGNPGEAARLPHLSNNDYALLAPARAHTRPDLGRESLHVPAGGFTFTIAAPRSEWERNTDEPTQTTAMIAKEFWPGKTEVTQARKAPLPANPSMSTKSVKSAPGENITPPTAPQPPPERSAKP